MWLAKGNYHNKLYIAKKRKVSSVRSNLNYFYSIDSLSRSFFFMFMFFKSIILYLVHNHEVCSTTARRLYGEAADLDQADLRLRQFYALLFLMCPVGGGRIVYEPSELNQT